MAAENNYQFAEMLNQNARYLMCITMHLIVSLFCIFIWSADVYAYTDSRPLLPPFPNGVCNGNVITLPQNELYSTKSSPFNLFSSIENMMLPPRDVKVWLPPEYYKPEFRTHQFPVLYCHDGQNAMQDSDSWTGSSYVLSALNHDFIILLQYS